MEKTCKYLLFGMSSFFGCKEGELGEEMAAISAYDL
jgi:hypothetical protein